MELRNKTAFDNIRSRQKAKFKLLQDKLKPIQVKDEKITNVTQKEIDTTQSKWVINISKHKLTPDESSLLKKGLNFAVTPDTIPVKDYIIGIESACKYLGPGSKTAET